MFIGYIYIAKWLALALADTSISLHNYHLCFEVGTSKINCLGNFQVYHATLLTLIIMMHVKSPELIYLIIKSVYSLTNIWQLPHCLFFLNLIIRTRKPTL